ncbi:MAG: hypothetical protein IJ634_02185 [Bacteroidales bacterium]|nr:hypothetical protein [Bacteroidales bacterium]
MKRLCIFTAVLLAVALAGVSLWHLLTPGTPTPSDLYHRYEHQAGVRVGYIEDYRFDDSTFVDVVTVEALDSAGWHWMEQEFALHEHANPEAPAAGSGPESVTLWQCDDGQNIAFCSWADSALCLVQPRSEREFEHIIIYHLQKIRQ